jgi:hypothetical protein
MSKQAFIDLVTADQPEGSSCSEDWFIATSNAKICDVLKSEYAQEPSLIVFKSCRQ